MPTCLVGHSLGGRAALLTASASEVKSAVALAPWVYPTDVAEGLDSQRILIVHGSKDRVASPTRSAELARRRGLLTRVAYVDVEGGKHAMLRRHAVFDSLAAQFATFTLLGGPSAGTMAEIDGGASWLRL